MHGNTHGYRHEGHADQLAGKPTALTLVTRILRALVAGDMLWLLAGAVFLVIYLQHIHYEQELLPVLLFGGLGIMAVLNGCKAWQNDLNEYRRQIVLSHRKRSELTTKVIPGYFPGHFKDRHD